MRHKWLTLGVSGVCALSAAPAAPQEAIDQRELALESQFERVAANRRIARAVSGAALAAPTLGDASLAVDGDVSLAADSNIFKDGGPWIWSDSGNVGVGGALSSNTIGDNNTAIGAGALESNTEGNFNSAMGFFALNANQTEIFNTAVGFFSQRYTTTDRNTAVGALSMHLHAGAGRGNTALGYYTLGESADVGNFNTGVGFQALIYNEGDHNTAVGTQALFSNTTGLGNTALGWLALVGNTTGTSNTGLGRTALTANTTGNFNHAIGRSVMFSLDGGSYNIAIGHLSDPDPPYWDCAGCGLTSGSHNILLANTGTDVDNGTIRIGNSTDHSSTFIAGIHNVGITAAHAVYVDANGQLGMTASSSRFKKNIQDMGSLSQALLDLRPVRFERREDENGRTQFGLIAEEVDEVLPELVVYDEEGLPRAVKYHLLSPMLLNEVKRQEKELAAQREALVSRDREIVELRAAVADLRRRLDGLSRPDRE